jgi:hypothetical protein
MNKLALQLILALALGVCRAFAESVVSPDGKYIVFVKTVSGPTIGWGAGEEQPSELWQTDADGGNPVLLCRTHSDDDMREVVAAFKDLRFSSDGRLVYFTTPAWATSGAVHVVNTTNRTERFVCDGAIIKVIPTAQGDRLVVGKHKYDTKGGYWQDFLVTPEGNELRPIGKKER